MHGWVDAVAVALLGIVLITSWACLRLYRALRLSVQSFQAVIQGTSDAIVMEDERGRITHWSPGAHAMFGYTAEEMLGQSRQCLVPPEQRLQDDMVTAQLEQQPKTIVCSRLGKAGQLRPVLLTYSALLDSRGQRIGLCYVMRDAQRQNVADELIRSMSFNDALTGLPNWRLLQDRLWRAQLNSERQRTHFAVLYVDLDGFKAINDQHGHEAGNKLLMEVATRLMASVRQKDTVARLGGDEFIVLLEDLGTDEFHARNHANAVADKLLDLMEGRLFKLGDVEVNCSASIGIQVVQGGNGHVDQLIKQADAAMARVKKGRRMVARGDYAGRASG